MSADESRAPKVRFKRCSGDWVTKKLGDLTPLRGGFAFLSAKYRKAGIPIVKISNILSTGEVGGEFAFYDEQPDDDNYLLPDGAAVLAMSGATTGKVSILQRAETEKVYQNQRVGYFENIGCVDYCFISTLVRSDFFRSQLDAVLVAGAQPNVSSKEINNFDFSMPIEPAEQTQIGAYFTSLDRMIGLHQRKHDKLVTLKQAMLQKMFPQDGATTPEIRFKGFDGEWEERELLKNITKIIDFRGRTPKKLGLDWSGKGYLALSAVNVKNGYIDFSVEAHFGDEDLYNVWMKGAELHKGQVLFTTEAPMGNVAQVPDDRKYILSQRTIAFELDQESLLEDFLAVLLRTPFMFRKLSSLSSGGTAKGVSQRSLESVTSVFPTDIEEQKKIGTYFRNLDNLISKHATQLSKLKNIKSACLEKMFV